MLYAPALQRAPIYLAHDEVIFALNAHQIATTGRDLMGRVFPLYVGFFWATPLNIYLTAALLKVAPLSEAFIRLPTVLVGMTDVVLLYFVGRRVFDREPLAITAAVLLALTPAHFIHSRLGVDHLYPLPFVIGWLLCLLTFLERRRLAILFTGTAALGVGFYSYLAAVIMMPVFFMMTCAVLAWRVGRSARMYAAATLGFVLPLLPLIPWHLRHPAQYVEQLKAYGLYDPARGHPWRGLLALLSYPSVSARASVYYNFFNPSLLFLSGDTSVVNSTRHAGVFLLPVAALLLFGIHQIVSVRRTAAGIIALVGLALSPLAAVIVGEVMINRALIMLPFAALVATYGVQFLLEGRAKVRPVVVVCLLAALPVQFAAFYADYLTGYRVRSSRWFERNIRGAVEEILARDRQEGAPAVYLSRDIGWIDLYWRLYLIKYHREELLDRTVYYYPKSQSIEAIPWKSLVLANAGEAGDDAQVSAGRLFRLSEVLEPDRTASFSLFERN